MKMNVGHPEAVDGDADAFRISGCFQRPGSLLSDLEDSGIERFSQIKDMIHMSFGNQASVPRIARMNAQESQEIIGLPDSMSRLNSFDDLAEDAIVHEAIYGRQLHRPGSFLDISSADARKRRATKRAAPGATASGAPPRLLRTS